MIGFQCWYAGAGDDGPAGAGANAVVECSGLRGDGGSGTWVCAQ
jgi:hypothetical protein